MIDEFWYGGAGRSARRWYKNQARSWRRRTFGRWATFSFLTVLLTVLAVIPHLSPPRWQLLFVFFFGALVAATMLLPDVLLPDHIARKQRGAWGEQSTAIVLRRLKRRGWTVRHDLAAPRGNRDHVVVGPSLFLLDSKNWSDSEVTIEGDVLRVRRIEDPDDGYTTDDPAGKAQRQARALERELRLALGFGAAVNPVVVVWGRFTAGEQWIGNVAFVAGDRLAAWLEARPRDLVDPAKQAAVAAWVRGLPRAELR